MKMIRLAGALAALLMVCGAVRAQQADPTEQHKWLGQLVGEWDVASEAKFGPDMPPITCTGKEAVRKVGGLWTVSELVADWMGNEMTGVMSLGYDPDKKKYVGTWIDSSSNYMWNYVGTVDESGKVLTLEAEGPNPLAPGKKAKFRDVITIKDKDHKVMTSSMQGENGKWTTFMTANYTRKKSK